MSIYHLRAVAAATAIAGSACAFAHDGDLDPSFGTNGLTVIDFGASATAYGLAIDPSGRVVLGGIVDGGTATGTDFAVARLTRDGQPDTTFSFDGKTTVAVAPGNTSDFSFNTIVQSDGKIVVIGEGADTADPSDDSDFKLVRLNTDFSLQGLTSQELLAIVSAWQNNAISRDTMFELFRRGEILPDGRTNDEELRLLAQPGRDALGR